MAGVVGAGACSGCNELAAGSTASFAVDSATLALGAAIEAEFSSPETESPLGTTVGAVGCKAVVTPALGDGSGMRLSDALVAVALVQR